MPAKGYHACCTREPQETHRGWLSSTPSICKFPFQWSDAQVPLSSTVAPGHKGGTASRDNGNPCHQAHQKRAQKILAVRRGTESDPPSSLLCCLPSSSASSSSAPFFLTAPLEETGNQLPAQRGSSERPGNKQGALTQQLPTAAALPPA